MSPVIPVFYHQLLVGVTLLFLLVAAALWFIQFLIAQGYILTSQTHAPSRHPPSPKLKSRELAIYHAQTYRPLKGVEVLLLDENGIVIGQAQSNRSGRVGIKLPRTSQAIRFSLAGYQVQTTLLPLPKATVFLPPLAPVRREWVAHTLHSLQMCHLISLGLGTLALTLLALIQITFGVFLVSLAYLGFWVVLFQRVSQTYSLAQLIDTISGQPVTHASVLFHYEDHTRYTVSDSFGFIRLPRPLPPTISYYKRGYEGKDKQALPATAVGPDLIVFPLTPARR